MKTEDLKNYIFKQLNETSKERAEALARGRDAERLEALAAAQFASKHFDKIKKQKWLNKDNLHPDQIAAMRSARDQFMDLAGEKFSKGRKARNRSLGLRGDGSPHPPR